MSLFGSCLVAQRKCQLYSQVCGSQQLSNCMQDSSIEPEIIPGTGDLASGTLEKNLPLPLCKISTIPYYIRNLTFISTDEYLHPSIRRPLLTAHRNHHRKAQLDPMQRSADHGKSGPNGCICVTAPTSVGQGTSQKTG